jgi:hypothetical protein
MNVRFVKRNIFVECVVCMLVNSLRPDTMSLCLCGDLKSCMRMHAISLRQLRTSIYHCLNARSHIRCFQDGLLDSGFDVTARGLVAFINCETEVSVFTASQTVFCS